MVRDKNTIRGYWIYEAVTEPAFRVPWIGKVKVPEGVGYDYQARIHGMAEYDGRMYLTDWYNKSVQVFTPSKWRSCSVKRHISLPMPCLSTMIFNRSDCLPTEANY